MPKLHEIEPIVTPDRYEFGVHRMNVAGGWIYVMTVPGAGSTSTFVPDSASDRSAPEVPIWPDRTER